MTYQKLIGLARRNILFQDVIDLLADIALELTDRAQVESTSTGRKYRTQTRISCTSSNVIYLIQCTICKKQYVGQTRNKLLIRINQHYSSIRNKLETPVSRHFQGHNCTEPYPVRIFILSLIKDADNAQELRNKWERIWMARLNSYVPYGMNILD